MYIFFSFKANIWCQCQPVEKPVDAIFGWIDWHNTKFAHILRSWWQLNDRFSGNRSFPIFIYSLDHNNNHIHRMIRLINPTQQYSIEWNRLVHDVDFAPLLLRQKRNVPLSGGVRFTLITRRYTGMWTMDECHCAAVCPQSVADCIISLFDEIYAKRQASVWAWGQEGRWWGD